MSCLIIQEYSMLTVFLDCDTWVLEPSRYTRYKMTVLFFKNYALTGSHK